MSSSSISISPSSLPSLLRRFVASSTTIDKHVMSSSFIRKSIFDFDDDGPELNPFVTDPPEYYLEKEDLLNFWDRYFNHLMSEWDADRLSYMKLNAIIERLSAPAAEMDVCGQEIVRIYRGLRNTNVPEELVQGVLRRCSAVNAFLNSADIGIEVWKHNDKIPVEGGGGVRRRRRPQLNPQPTEQEEVEGHENLLTTVTTRDTSFIEAPASKRPITRITHRILGTLNHNTTIITLTCTITLLSSILQTLSFAQSIYSAPLSSTSTSTPATPIPLTSDPNFLSTLQSTTMQLLSLYITLLPFLRHPKPNTDPANANSPYPYPHWSLLVLASSSFLTSIAAPAIYAWNAPLAPFLLFVGNALQGFMVLQLVWLVDSVGASVSSDSSSSIVANQQNQKPRTGTEGVRKEV